MSCPVRIVVVTGPTAAGKSDLAIAVARRLDAAEVVNADAMQLYRGMDVGTAKVPEGERAGVVHHLLDVLDVDHPASVAEFQTLARAAIEDCLTRGVTPIVVGGSSLYVRAIIDPLDFPGTDPEVRARWEARLVAVGPEALHAELAERAPEAAAAILPTNGRRIVRALEVIDLTGTFAATLPPKESVYDDVVLLGVDCPRDVLDARIVERVDRMWDGGLLEETAALPDLAGSPTASKAIGYAQALAFLAGEIDAEQAKAEIVTATRKFARRQDRLFHQDPRITWLPFDSPSLVDDAVDVVRAGGPAN